MTEQRRIAQHAATVFIGQIAIMAFGLTDTLIAGQYSPTALAALAVGSSIYITVFVSLNGVMNALLPMLSEKYGANQLGELGRLYQQGLYVCLILCLLGCTLLLHPHMWLQLAQVPKELEATVTHYLAIAAISLPPALLFRMFSTLNQSMGQPQTVTIIQVMALVLKVPLSIVLGLGFSSFEGWGLIGCMWATFVVNLGMLVGMLWMLKNAKKFRPLHIGRPIALPHWPTIRSMLALGVPNGLSLLVEVSSFAFMALFIARMGHIALAAHQIAANLATLMYMVPLSLSIATSARVSFWIGAKRSDLAIKTQRLGIAWVVALACMLSGLLFWLRHPIASLYSSQAEVVSMGAVLLGWLALFHLGDALQVVGMFLLRCYRVTLVPLLVYAIFLWGIGLGMGYALAYVGTNGLSALQHPSAFWITSSTALALTSTTLMIVLKRQNRLRLVTPS